MSVSSFVFVSRIQQFCFCFCCSCSYSYCSVPDSVSCQLSESSEYSCGYYSGSGARAHLPPLPPAIRLRWGRLESSIRTIPNLPARSPPGDVVRACVEHQKKKEGPTHGPKPTARY